MQLEFYHRWACPYSAKVREFIKDNDLEGRMKMTEIDEVEGAIETLMKLNEKPQVPCLVIDGKPLLESKDIINWLDGNIVRSASSMNP